MIIMTAHLVAARDYKRLEKFGIGSPGKSFIVET